ncbi:MAG: flagellar basal body rod protein FlgC [Nevskiaceae bacterium]|jgi:flagellar basal-body rod protein FlgC|nr:MAG: flagellar basal body rod protein FlgC [Nevskiaceae bacterium]TAM29440.1 MAG: flagellar basal body rod protein FlgC [Nevskiaceae bacterium]
MSRFPVFDVAGSALAAQSVRLNATASNLANANNLAGSPEAVYRAHEPVFQSVDGGVRVQEVREDSREPQKLYQPGHPLADPEGYVYAPNVNVVEEMVNMISASRSYQSNIEVFNTTKDLALRTLTLGK